MNFSILSVLYRLYIVALSSSMSFFSCCAAADSDIRRNSRYIIRLLMYRPSSLGHKLATKIRIITET
jgi:hypothetical protein